MWHSHPTRSGAQADIVRRGHLCPLWTIASNAWHRLSRNNFNNLAWCGFLLQIHYLFGYTGECWTFSRSGWACDTCEDGVSPAVRGSNSTRPSSSSIWTTFETRTSLSVRWYEFPISSQCLTACPRKWLVSQLVKSLKWVLNMRWSVFALTLILGPKMPPHAWNTFRFTCNKIHNSILKTSYIEENIRTRRQSIWLPRGCAQGHQHRGLAQLGLLPCLRALRSPLHQLLLHLLHLDHAEIGQHLTDQQPFQALATLDLVQAAHQPNLHWYQQQGQLQVAPWLPLCHFHFHHQFQFHLHDRPLGPFSVWPAWAATSRPQFSGPVRDLKGLLAKVPVWHEKWRWMKHDSMLGQKWTLVKTVLLIQTNSFHPVIGTSITWWERRKTPVQVPVPQCVIWSTCKFKRHCSRSSLEGKEWPQKKLQQQENILEVSFHRPPCMWPHIAY